MIPDVWIFTERCQNRGELVHKIVGTNERSQGAFARCLLSLRSYPVRGFAAKVFAD